MQHLPATDLTTLTHHVGEILEMNTISENVDGIELIGSLVLFDIGQSVVSGLYDVVMDHIKIRLNYFVKELECTKSPTVTATIHNELHLVVRTLLSLIRLGKFARIEKNWIVFEEIISLVNLEGIPLEIQGNSTKILTLMMSTKENGIKSLTQQLSSDAECQLLDKMNCELRVQLNVCHAIMSSLEKEILNDSFDPKGTLLGAVVLPIIMKSQDDG